MTATETPWQTLARKIAGVGQVDREWRRAIADEMVKALTETRTPEDVAVDLTRQNLRNEEAGRYLGGVIMAVAERTPHVKVCETLYQQTRHDDIVISRLARNPRTPEDLQIRIAQTQPGSWWYLLDNPNATEQVLEAAYRRWQERSAEQRENGPDTIAKILAHRGCGRRLAVEIWDRELEEGRSGLDAFTGARRWLETHPQDWAFALSVRLAQSAAREKISVRWLDAAYGKEQLRQMAELAEHGWERSFRELSAIVET